MSALQGAPQSETKQCIELVFPLFLFLSPAADPSISALQGVLSGKAAAFMSVSISKRLPV